ncbi:hypothetical protein KIPB_007717, partial [Kipferlia bialata]
SCSNTPSEVADSSMRQLIHEEHYWMPIPDHLGPSTLGRRSQSPLEAEATQPERVPVDTLPRSPVHIAINSDSGSMHQTPLQASGVSNASAVDQLLSPQRTGVRPPLGNIPFSVWESALIRARRAMSPSDTVTVDSESLPHLVLASLSLASERVGQSTSQVQSMAQEMASLRRERDAALQQNTLLTAQIGQMRDTIRETASQRGTASVRSVDSLMEDRRGERGRERARDVVGRIRERERERSPVSPTSSRVERERERQPRPREGRPSRETRRELASLRHLVDATRDALGVDPDEADARLPQTATELRRKLRRALFVPEEVLAADTLLGRYTVSGASDPLGISATCQSIGRNTHMIDASGRDNIGAESLLALEPEDLADISDLLEGVGVDIPIVPASRLSRADVLGALRVYVVVIKYFQSLFNVKTVQALIP